MMSSLPRILGYLGVFPFMLLLVVKVIYVDLEAQSVLTVSMIGYGTIIAAFLGGIHWSVGLQTGNSSQIFFSVMPTIIGLALLTLSFVANQGVGILPAGVLLTMAAMYVGIYVADLRMIPESFFPSDYFSFRRNLTIIIAVIYVLAALTGLKPFNSISV